MTINYRKTENWRGRYYCVDGYTEYHTKFLTKRRRKKVLSLLGYYIKYGTHVEGMNTAFGNFLCQFVEHKKLLVWKMFHSNLIRLVSFEKVFATLGIELKIYVHGKWQQIQN